jgi:hypothetical protein
MSNQQNNIALQHNTDNKKHMNTCAACVQADDPANSEIAVTKAGPTAPVKANEELTFTLTAKVVKGSISSMILTDTIDVGTGITFLRISPDAGAGQLASAHVYLLLISCTQADFACINSRLLVTSDSGISFGQHSCRCESAGYNASVHGSVCSSCA